MDTPPSQEPASEMLEAVRQLVQINQHIAQSLANLEALYAQNLREQAEQRKAFAVRQKEWDERQSEREQKSEKRQKKWEEQREKMTAAPSGPSWQSFAAVLLLAVLLLAIAQLLQAILH